ncbi:hypothetical protein Tcur_1980 [Thermomonospora curvata DSM 43183]|uniref:Uncharacterized protein n=1 Tax=Thermomonospora curvata (strain ATCC 19995 / DSM 43183 / JCM 3096 / KCTC 9072 / NBRC 15933 / NCIMB 10081 / Henssen B9) TaxID=471852 RepID=D1ADT7_THECD|nr:hypothetical protein Tcur_1980 [Thermomonospora curvata DSM 43183]
MPPSPARTPVPAEPSPPPTERVGVAGVERHVAQARPEAAARVATAQRKREAAEQ